MRWRQLPARMWLSYLGLVAATAWVLIALPPPGGFENVPAIPAIGRRVGGAPGDMPRATAAAPPATGPAPPAARSALLTRWMPPENWLQARIGEGMPAYGAFTAARRDAGAARGAPTPAWRIALHQFAARMTGIDPARPVSVLGSTLPAFALRVPDHDELEIEVPSPRLRFDPQGRITAPPPPVEAPVVEPERFGDRPLVGVYSTHHFESFVSELPRKPDAAGDVAVYDDNRRNVVAVAGEFARALSERHGVAAAHSPARHDVGGYSLSYDYSRVTAQRLIKEYPSVRVLVDVHRDSTPRNADTVKRVRGEDHAGIRLVVARGNPASRAYAQPNYEKTRAFAEALFRVMDELYPGLKRDIFERDARYNQDLLPGAILVEVGGPDNTMDEAIRSAHAFAHVLAETLKRGLAPR